MEWDRTRALSSRSVRVWESAESKVRCCVLVSHAQKSPIQSLAPTMLQT